MTPRTGFKPTCRINPLKNYYSKLPTELVEMVAKYLPVKDLLRFRLVDRKSRNDIFNHFTNSQFSKKQFMMSKFSLETLFDISQHPEIKHKLRYLSFATNHYHEEPSLYYLTDTDRYDDFLQKLELAGRLDDFQVEYEVDEADKVNDADQVDDADASGDSHDESHEDKEGYHNESDDNTEEDDSDEDDGAFCGSRAYRWCRARAAQEVIMYTHEGRELLVEAFRNLPNLTSICIRNWDVEWPSDPDSLQFHTYGSTRIENYVGYKLCRSLERRSYEDTDLLVGLSSMVLGALNKSSCYLDLQSFEVDLAHASERPKLFGAGLELPFSFGDALEDRRHPLWRCKSLTLPIFLKGREGLDQDNVDELVGMLAQSSNLQERSLAFLRQNTEEQDDDETYWDEGELPLEYHELAGLQGPSKFLTSLTNSNIALRKISLGVGEYQSNDISSLLSKLAGTGVLKEVELSQVCLRSSWRKLLQDLREPLKLLKNLKLGALCELVTFNTQDPWQDWLPVYLITGPSETIREFKYVELEDFPDAMRRLLEEANIKDCSDAIELLLEAAVFPGDDGYGKPFV